LPCRLPSGSEAAFSRHFLRGALTRKIPVGLYVPLLEFNRHEQTTLDFKAARVVHLPAPLFQDVVSQTPQ
jgi:hypothetical protein